MVTTFFKLEL